MGLSRWRLPRLFCGNTTLIIPHYPMIKIILWEVSKQPIYSPGKISKKINKFFSREKNLFIFFSFSHLTTVYQLRYIQCYQWLTPFFRPFLITKYLTCKGTLNVYHQKLNSKSSLVIRGKQKYYFVPSGERNPPNQKFFIKKALIVLFILVLSCLGQFLASKINNLQH